MIQNRKLDFLQFWKISLANLYWLHQLFPHVWEGYLALVVANIRSKKAISTKFNGNAGWVTKGTTRLHYPHFPTQQEIWGEHAHMLQESTEHLYFFPLTTASLHKIHSSGGHENFCTCSSFIAIGTGTLWRSLQNSHIPTSLWQSLPLPTIPVFL